MNKQEQKRYLKQSIQELSKYTSYSFPPDPVPPARIKKAMADAEKANRIVRTWNEAKSEKADEARLDLRERVAAIRRSFAFEEPEKTLALIDDFKRHVKKFEK